MRKLLLDGLDSNEQAIFLDRQKKEANGQVI